MVINRYCLLFLLWLPITVKAWQWDDIWLTRDQQGMHLLKAGKPDDAAQRFEDKQWKGVANYRANQFEKAYKTFINDKSSDGQYNAGNAAALMGKYESAINAYDQALRMNPHHRDAIANRETVRKLLQQQQQLNKESDKHTSSPNKDSQPSSDKASPHPKPTAGSAYKKRDEVKPKTLNEEQKNQQSQPKSDATNDENEDKENANNGANMTRPFQSKPSSAQSKSMSEDINKNKKNMDHLLRRLPDETGGLLQRKFLRDYLNRHGGAQAENQGGYQ